MPAIDIAYAGAARRAELIRAGEVSSRDAAGLCLERIERSHRGVNAFRTAALGA